MQNSIQEVKAPNDELLASMEDIEAEAVRFFEDFLTQVPEGLDIFTVERLQGLLSF